MKEGASIVDHVNGFISVLSWLMSVDIKFDVEVQALLLLFSLPESWSDTVTAVSSSTKSTKLKFDNICDLLIGEDIRRKTSGEYSNSLLSKTEGRSRTKNQCSKPVTSKDKKVNMATKDYDDALVCCVKNTIDDRIMDSGASFHATYCKEEIERFKLRFGKNLKDVRYISGIKKRLISVGQLDEEGYHVPSDEINATIDVKGNAALWHQRLGHMSEKGMKILASKGRIPDLQKVVVGFCEPCILGKQKKVSFLKSENTGKQQRFELVHTDVYSPTSVASIGISRYYVTFIDDNNMKVKDVARDNLDAKSVKCTFIGYGSDEMGYHFWDSKGHKVVRSRDVTFNKDSLCGAKAAIDSSNLTKPDHKDQVVLEDSPKNLANKCIVVEHGLSSKINQSLGGSSDTSEGSENSGSFEDSGSSDEEDSEDRASFEEEGS
ncbi:retrovirus-related pol polyprotein from transposon TNT 1-94 [Tanacetum coccineum]|uniref:Retrovirus-related pol polyprotein from transposon TNT 1-94 n=1 Tax=Tanacetum coccineum TaxID=301880 RepID=A0ABQ5BI20_9ASTR